MWVNVLTGRPHNFVGVGRILGDFKQMVGFGLPLPHDMKMFSFSADFDFFFEEKNRILAQKTTFQQNTKQPFLRNSGKYQVPCQRFVKISCIVRCLCHKMPLSTIAALVFLY